MAKAATAKSYRRVRRWVDHDLTIHHRPLSIVGPVAVVGFATIYAHRAGGIGELVVWTLVGPLCAIWAGFVGWRIARLFRAMSIKGDRDYDRRVKFTLAAEHQRSESVTAASQRKRSQRRRSPRL